MDPTDELPPAVDREWLEDLRQKLEPRGARSDLARALGVDPSQISKLASGERAPAPLVIAASRHLGMMLPKSWLEDRHYKLLAAVRKAEALAQALDDPRRRAAIEALLDALVDDVTEQADHIADYGSVLGEKVRRWKRENESN